MDDIAGKRRTGSLVALRAHIGMPSYGIERRINVRNAGYRFSPVALPAGKVCPDGMDIHGLIVVAVLTPSPLVELNRPMGVG